jgi:hypothetical protein
MLSKHTFAASSESVRVCLYREECPSHSVRKRSLKSRVLSRSGLRVVPRNKIRL